MLNQLRSYIMKRIAVVGALGLLASGLMAQGLKPVNQTKESWEEISPRLPGGIAELRFRLRYRGRRLKVTINSKRARYELMEGDPLPLMHHGKPFKLGHTR